MTHRQVLAEVIARAQARPVMHKLHAGGGPRVALWCGQGVEPASPRFVGVIGNEQVTGAVRHGPEGTFIDFAGSVSKASVGHGRLVVNGAGMVRLVLHLQGQPQGVFVTVSNTLPQAVLIACGLNEQLQLQRRQRDAQRRLLQDVMFEALAA